MSDEEIEQPFFREFPQENTGPDMLEPLEMLDIALSALSPLHWDCTDNQQYEFLLDLIWESIPHDQRRIASVMMSGHPLEIAKEKLRLLTDTQI